MSAPAPNRALALLAAALPLLLCGCPAGQSAGADAGTRECATRADCQAKGGDYLGTACLADLTCGACSSDGQCELREECDAESLRCVFRAGWGDDCALNAECSAGQLCVQGLCVAEKLATLCAAGSCLAEGQRCNAANGVCEEDIGCLTDADCSAVELCNVPTNACVLRCSADTVGQVCGAGQKCVNERCADCETSADCQGGMVCDLDRLTCVVDGAERCLSDRDCAAGLVCNLAAGFCTEPLPSCLSNEDCLVGERCDVGSGECVTRACQPDRYEPDDTQETAKAIASGDWDGLTLCDQEEDWYAIALARGDRLDVYVDADPLLQDVMDTRLFDQSGRALATGALALDKTVSADATYYLRLKSSDAFVDYGLRIAVAQGVPCDDDAFEPDDDAASAASLHAAGDYDKLRLCGLDRDWYRLDVPEGKKVRVELHYLPTEGAADLFVFAADGTTPLGADQTASPVQTVLADPQGAAQVLIEVASLDDRANAEYYLHVAFE